MENPGYLTPPTDKDYFLSGRGAFTTDDVHHSDLSVQFGWSFERFELFIQPVIINIFDEDAVTNVNTAVLTADDDPSLEPFNPFSETPVEGVHWRKGSNFGKPVTDTDFQTPRTFTLSVGFRF